MQKLFGFSLMLFCLCSFGVVAAPNTAAAVQYQITITTPEHHLAEIEMRLQVTAPGPMMLHLPAWRSGKYQILDLANGVRQFSVTDASGLLAFEKTDKSSWMIQVKSAGELVVRYQIYANQLDQRTRHIDDTHAYLNPSAVLMYHQPSRLLPVQVDLIVPASWRSTSGMARGEGPHQFKAANYDVLADSPIETGVHQTFSFEADDRSYEVVIWGQGNFDSKQIVEDLQKLVQQARFIWQGYPYQNYLFIIHSADGARGATEHLNSTVMQRDRFSFRSREHYLSFLSTAAHELVHTWNVKAYRPAELVPYDYLNPNYSKLLWVSEGSTSYFQNQLLLKAGLISMDEFYADIAKRLFQFSRLPGRQLQSVAESSFDNWINLGGDHAENFSVNIYSEGYLVSWLMDQWLLQHSDFKLGYRDLHQQLYARFGKTTGFTKQNMLDIAQQLTGHSMADFWQRYVESPLQFDPTVLLQSAGLELSAEPLVAYSGITGVYKDGVEKISKVQRDSAAWQAGLTADDEIIAVEQLQLKSALSERLKDFKAEQRINLSFFRQGRLLQRQITLTAAPALAGKIKVVAKPSKLQRAYHQAWLGMPLPDPEKKLSKIADKNTKR